MRIGKEKGMRRVGGEVSVIGKVRAGRMKGRIGVGG